VLLRLSSNTESIPAVREKLALIAIGIVLKLSGSESDAQIEAADYPEHCKQQTCSAKHGDHSERIDVRPVC
jgi:hypothetical protein